MKKENEKTKFTCSERENYFQMDTDQEVIDSTNSIKSQSQKDVRSVSPAKKISIPENLLRIAISQYKEQGSWERVHKYLKEKYQNYLPLEYKTLMSYIEELLGELEYRNLIREFSKKDIGYRKEVFTPPYTYLKEAIKKYKEVGDLTKVIGLLSESSDIKINPSNLAKYLTEYLGKEEFIKLKKMYKMLEMRKVARKLMAPPFTIIEEIINTIRESGSMEKGLIQIVKLIPETNIRLFDSVKLEYVLKDYLGEEEFQKLMKTLKKPKIERSIEITKEVFVKMAIDSYRKNGDLGRVLTYLRYELGEKRLAEILGTKNYSQQNVKFKIIEIMGEESYTNLITNYSGAKERGKLDGTEPFYKEWRDAGFSYKKYLLWYRTKIPLEIALKFKEAEFSSNQAKVLVEKSYTLEEALRERTKQKMSFPIKYHIPDETIEEVIELYKTLKAWKTVLVRMKKERKIPDEMVDGTFITKIRNHIGEVRILELMEEYGYRGGKFEKKLTEFLLEKTVQQYKKLKSWDEVIEFMRENFENFPEMNRTTISRKILKHLGREEFDKMVDLKEINKTELKEFKNSLIKRPNILVERMIKNYRETGSFEEVFKAFLEELPKMEGWKWEVSTLEDIIKEYLGEKEFSNLIKDYIEPIKKIPKQIEIEKNEIFDMLYQSFKKNGRMQKVLLFLKEELGEEIYNKHLSNDVKIRRSLIDHIGETEYENLIKNYSIGTKSKLDGTESIYGYWKKEGFSLLEYIRWNKTIFPLELAVKWKNAGFKPIQAEAFFKRGYSLEQAIRERSTMTTSISVMETVRTKYQGLSDEELSEEIIRVMDIIKEKRSKKSAKTIDGFLIEQKQSLENIFPIDKSKVIKLYVVIDINILISAVISRTGGAAKIIEKIKEIDEIKIFAPFAYNTEFIDFFQHESNIKYDDALREFLQNIKKHEIFEWPNVDYYFGDYMAEARKLLKFSEIKPPYPIDIRSIPHLADTEYVSFALFLKKLAQKFDPESKVVIISEDKRHFSILKNSEVVPWYSIRDFIKFLNREYKANIKKDVGEP